VVILKLVKGGIVENENVNQPVSVKFDYAAFFKQYGTWIIVAGVAVYVLYSLQSKKGGRPKVD
jgi:hypothetical protein